MRAVLKAVAFSPHDHVAEADGRTLSDEGPLAAVGAGCIGIAEEMNRRVVRGADAMNGGVGHDVQRSPDQRHAERDVEMLRRRRR